MLFYFLSPRLRELGLDRIGPERAAAAYDDAGAGGAPASDVHGDPGAVREIQAQGAEQFLVVFVLHIQDA